MRLTLVLMLAAHLVIGCADDEVEGIAFEFVGPGPVVGTSGDVTVSKDTIPGDLTAGDLLQADTGPLHELSDLLHAEDTHLVVDGVDSIDGVPDTADVPEPDTSDAVADAGCTKNADCESGLICVDGACVDAPCVPGTILCVPADTAAGAARTCKSDGSGYAQAVPCADSNPCTTESCTVGLGCTQVATLGACDDSNHCTVGDTCANDGLCLGTPKDCVDANPCTQDDCEPATGCQHLPADGACDDADPCTVGDACAKGSCAPGSSALACDDSDPCTMDGCTKGAGCTHAKIAACCKSAAQCDDGTVCTTDACPAGTHQCTHVPNSSGCEDGSLCTVGDACAEGKCKGGAPANCTDNDPNTLDTCDPNLGCQHVPSDGPCDKDSDCNDKNACTSDKCVSEWFGPKKCTHTAIQGCCVTASNCATGDSCKQASSCKDGKCVPGPNQSDGFLCTIPEKDQCFTGQCSKGQCKPLDGQVCTTDSGACPAGICQGGACAPIAGQPCEATFDIGICEKVVLNGSCGPLGGCKPQSIPTQYQCSGCNGLCATCLGQQICLPIP